MFLGWGSALPSFNHWTTFFECLVCFRQHAECSQYSFPWEIHTCVLWFMNQIIIKFMVLYQILEILWKMKYPSSPKGARGLQLQWNVVEKLFHFRGIHSQTGLSRGPWGNTQPSSAARTAFPRWHLSWDLKGGEGRFRWSSRQRKEVAVQSPRAKESSAPSGTCQSFRMNECRKW